MPEVESVRCPSDASKWVWSCLWKSGTSQATFDIVETIWLRDKNIEGWIFTASDGAIKRKSTQKWTLSSAEKKCRSHNGNLRAQVLDGEKWQWLPDNEFRIPCTATCLVSTSQLTDNLFFIEQLFEMNQGISSPRMVTYRLTSSDIKGMSSFTTEACSFPSERIICKNKYLNGAMKEKMVNFINMLEHRSQTKIHKLVAVFAVEDSSGAGESYRIRFHHAKEVLYKPSRKKLFKKDDVSETRSIISESTNFRGGSREMKCCGDFCGFNEAYESTLSDMDEELKFRIDIEAAKARRRHRNVDDEKEISNDDDNVESNSRFQKDLIESTLASNALTDVPSSSQCFKVPLKSLVLARNEMKLLDGHESYTPEVHAWSKTLQAWYRRTGRATISRRNVNIPPSSAYNIDNAMMQIAEHGSVVDESFLDTNSEKSDAHSPKLTEKSLQSIANGNSSVATSYNEAVPYDLHTKPFRKQLSSDAKHFSRYYSNISVCQKCYHVYKDLDRLRQRGNRRGIQERKEYALRAKEGLESYEDLERINRYTNQSFQNIRLSQAKAYNDESNYGKPGEIKPFRSKDGAPKGMLPPLPWKLSRQDVAADYKQAGSSFVRSIGDKARLIARADKNQCVFDPVMEEESVLNPNYDWKKNLAPQPTLLKSKSAGCVTRSSKKKKNSRGFYCDRLLHPHQRMLATMRREQSRVNAPQVRVKGGAKRKVVTARKLPPLRDDEKPRPSSPITYDFVRKELGQASIASAKSKKSVTFQNPLPTDDDPSVKRYDDNDDDDDDDNYDDDDDDDEIGYSCSILIIFIGF